MVQTKIRVLLEILKDSASLIVKMYDCDNFSSCIIYSSLRGEGLKLGKTRYAYYPAN